MGADQQPRERWSPGDLAECIHAGGWFEGGLVPTEHGPRYGEVRMVTAVSAARHPLTGQIGATLCFDRFGNRAFTSIVFRKVTPRSDAAVRADERFCRDFGPGCRPAPAHASEVS